MGVDLRLLPLLGQNAWVAHDILSLQRNGDLFRAIEDLPSVEIPQDLSCFLATDTDGESCYGEVAVDPYGDRLKYVSAFDLLRLKTHPDVDDNWKNCAVFAYLAQMPPDWPIVLYWH
jgi:hypothetical protein